MQFEFTTATRIRFGAGVLAEAGPAAKALGTRALVVTGKNVARAQPLFSCLRSGGVAAVVFPVGGEPALEDVARGVELAKAENCVVVISFGGGSAIDAAKAIAALMTNAGAVLDYLEVIGGAKALVTAPAPCIAIPTTAGTGAEVTRNAVLVSPKHGVKASLRSRLLLPVLALVDPELTYDLTPALTASTGLDALTQLIEPYVSSKANPLTDAICVEGIRRAARSLRRAFDDSTDKSAREDMALASLLGGLALANAGLGAVHGFAAPIGGKFSAPHGAVCAALLPHVMQANLIALHAREPRALALRRYDEVARLLTSSDHAGAAEGVGWVEHLCAHVQIPPLRRYGITSSDFPALVEGARNASSMKANPIPLVDDEMIEILGRAW